MLETNKIYNGDCFTGFLVYKQKKPQMWLIAKSFQILTGVGEEGVEPPTPCL